VIGCYGVRRDEAEERYLVWWCSGAAGPGGLHKCAPVRCSVAEGEDSFSLGKKDVRSPPCSLRSLNYL
jgi:hypothetical protein